METQEVVLEPEKQAQEVVHEHEKEAQEVVHEPVEVMDYNTKRTSSHHHLNDDDLGIMQNWNLGMKLPC